MPPQQLNIDLHMHTSLDPQDGPTGNGNVLYTYEQAIDTAAARGITVLSLTHHNKLVFTRAMKDYAAKKGILLIPGFEATVEESHVVIINAAHDRVTTWKELARYRKAHPESFIFAPHPFYPLKSAMKEKARIYHHLFDGVEYGHFYSRFHNKWNDAAVRFAKDCGLPMIGTSDAHHLFEIGKTYTQINAKKTVPDIIRALKTKPQVITQPMSLFDIARVMANFYRWKRVKI